MYNLDKQKTRQGRKTLGVIGRHMTTKTLIFIFIIFSIVTFGQKTLTIGLQPNRDTVKVKTEKINKIFTSDTITILVHSNGCFHSVTDKYEIIKKSDIYAVSFYTKNNADNIQNCKQTVKITAVQFRAMNKICLRGPDLTTGLCTTRNTFVIQNKKTSTYFIDDRCANKDDLSNLLRGLTGIKCSK